MSVVTGYIPTAEGEAALDRAIEEAQRLNTVLVVINSSRGDAYVDNRFIQPDDAASLKERLQQAKVEHILQQPVRGHDAADEVVEAAGKHRADLIVIGLRRRTPVGKLIMGSTAQQILLEAQCPVLAVKAAYS